MADSVELAFRRAAGRLLPDGATVLAAVSGGGDSVALAHLLVARRPRGPGEVVVAHLDHGLRRGSAADRRFVERLARDLGVRCVSDRRPVGELRRRGESPEEAARRVRRGFLLETARATGAAAVATGHTLDDQAETVLLRLLRGAGPSALAGMAERGPGPFVRPLLAVERERVRAFLVRRGIAFREDPSNRDVRFDRNRLRRRVIPWLAREVNAGAARHLVAAADLLREDAELLDSISAERRRRAGGGPGRIAAAALRAAPAPLARRVAVALLRESGVDPRKISRAHVEAILDLAAGGRGRVAHLPGGLEARRDGDDVVVRVC